MKRKIRLIDEPEMYHVTEENSWQVAKRLAEFVFRYGPQKAKKEYYEWARKANVEVMVAAEEYTMLEAMASLVYRERRQTLKKERAKRG